MPRGCLSGNLARSHILWDSFFMPSRRDTFDPRAILKDRRLRATPERLATIAALARADAPLSLADLAKRIRADAPHLATLYRTVRTLEIAGLIRRVDMAHRHAHYEFLAPGAAHHHHIVCRLCGKIAELEHVEARALESRELAAAGFVDADAHTLEYFGTCASCAHRPARRGNGKADRS